jgi:hypothetical protein
MTQVGKQAMTLTFDKHTYDKDKYLQKPEGCGMALTY